MAEEGATEHLIRLLDSPENEIQRLGAVGLTNLCRTPEATAAIISADGLTPLIALLSHPDPRLQRQAGRALSNLSLHNVPRAQIVSIGGHVKLIELATASSPEVMTEAIRALCNLARSATNTTKLVAAGVLPPIVAMLSSSNIELSALAVVALTNIVVEADNVPACLDAGAMAPLAVLCNSPDQKVAQMAQDCVQKLQKKAFVGGVAIPFMEYGKTPLKLQQRHIKKEELKSWCKATTPLGHTVQCRVKRDKVTGFYDCFLDDDTRFQYLVSFRCPSFIFFALYTGLVYGIS